MAIVNDEQVMKVLRQYNPWWRTPSAIKEESKLESAENALSIYEAMYPVTGTRYVFFDEVQYTENWELWMKVIYDSRKDIRLIATGSASPVLEKGSADSGTGRWSVLKIPTMSFYEYCRLLDLDLPRLPDDLRLSGLKSMSLTQLGDLMDKFTPLQNHFNRYLMIGGFPELVLSDDDAYAQRMLREDVVVELPRQKILCEVKYRNNSHIAAADAITELCQDEKSNVTDAFFITKRLDDFGIAKHETMVPILRVPAIAFLYILGKAEAEGQNGKL